MQHYSQWLSHGKNLNVTNEWMKKKYIYFIIIHMNIKLIIIYEYHLAIKKENMKSCYSWNMNRPLGCYVKWHKSDRKT